jgi:hypothetical protein
MPEFNGQRHGRGTGDDQTRIAGTSAGFFRTPGPQTNSRPVCGVCRCSFPTATTISARPVCETNAANKCRPGGIQIGTIDALLAQLCLRHGLTMLTADRDFHNIAAHCALKLWRATA